MPAAPPGIYQALGMHLETTLVLPELIQAAPSVERDGAAILLLGHPTAKVHPHPGLVFASRRVAPTQQ